MNDYEYELIGESIWNTYEDMAYLLMGEAKTAREHATAISKKVYDRTHAKWTAEISPKAVKDKPDHIPMLSRVSGDTAYQYAGIRRQRRLKQAKRLGNPLGKLARKGIGKQSLLGKRKRKKSQEFPGGNPYEGEGGWVNPRDVD